MVKAKKRGRPRSGPVLLDQTITVSCSADDMAAVDRHRAACGYGVTRSAVLLTALRAFLEENRPRKAVNP